MFCMAVPFAGSQANTQQMNTSVCPEWKYCSQLKVQALDSWVDRRKVVLHFDKCCDFRPICRGGGGRAGPLMGEEVHLHVWVNESTYRSLNMIGVCVQYTFSILYVHNAQDWGLMPPLPFFLFPYTYGLWSAPIFISGLKWTTPPSQIPPTPHFSYGA